MDAQVQRIRSFNRLVTERIGALNEEYLARPRPLGASRLLWEIGSDGVRVRDLRRRLGLDSGYMSRLLRGLESEGLVTVGSSDEDSRVRRVSLSAAGMEEVSRLDTDSDELAASILSPLSPDQREALVAAVAEVERLLTAGLVEVEICDPSSEDARFCISRYFEELDERFDGGFDPSTSISADVEELTEPSGLLLVARLRSEPVGCGALKFHGEAPAEVKRMWVSDSMRGLGLGRRVLSELERCAAARSVDALRLETNSALHEAIGLYRAAGYKEVPAFNDEHYAHHWFEKRLDQAKPRD
jgi:DNA-binding MarR family transcriptional regulator/GNAT superfamily N-acetyltransferase